MIALFILIGGAVILFFSSRRVAASFSFLRRILPSNKLQQQIKKLYHLIYSCRDRKRYLVFAFILSILFQSVLFYSIYLLSEAIALDLPLVIFCFLMPLVFLFGLLPSINGLGVREGAFVYFFSFFTAPEKALALSLLLDLLIYSMSFFGFFVYLTMGRIRYRDMKEAHFEDIDVAPPSES